MINHCLQGILIKSDASKGWGKGLFRQDSCILVPEKLGSAMGATKSYVDTDLMKGAQRDNRQFPTSADRSKA